MSTVRQVKMVIANTQPDSTGRFPQFTPTALRSLAAKEKESVPLLLDFDPEKQLGTVGNFTYDEEREELVAEAIVQGEIVADLVPAVGYIWDMDEDTFTLTSVGLTTEPAKPGTRILEDDTP